MRPRYSSERVIMLNRDVNIKPKGETHPKLNGPALGRNGVVIHFTRDWLLLMQARVSSKVTNVYINTILLSNYRFLLKVNRITVDFTVVGG